MMKIHREITIQAPIEKVWHVVGNQYDRVDEWAGSVNKSTPIHQQIPKGAPCGGRVCQTTLGPFQEKILRFDEKDKVLEYQASGSKMPFFVKSLANRWSLSKTDADHALVHMTMSVDIMPVFRWIMGPMMRVKLGRVARDTLEELSHYIEQDRPHPRKISALAGA